MEEKLSVIRRHSNIIAALENLITQCGDWPEYSFLKGDAERYLLDVEKKLRKLIHGSD